MVGRPVYYNIENKKENSVCGGKNWWVISARAGKLIWGKTWRIIWRHRQTGELLHEYPMTYEYCICVKSGKKKSSTTT
jgi:hypothetical protein